MVFGHVRYGIVRAGPPLHVPQVSLPEAVLCVFRFWRGVRCGLRVCGLREHCPARSARIALSLQVQDGLRPYVLCMSSVGSRVRSVLHVRGMCELCLLRPAPSLEAQARGAEYMI